MTSPSECFRGPRCARRGQRFPVKQTIIVLEDDTDISNLVRYHLQQIGFSIHTCTSGEQALSVAREVFIALAGKWLAIDSRILAEFQKLIDYRANDEAAFHSFLENNPHTIFTSLSSRIPNFFKTEAAIFSLS